MRVGFLLVAALFLVPVAAAQLPFAPPASAPPVIQVSVGAFTAAAAPYKAAVAAPLTAKISCALILQGGKDGLPVQLVVDKKPDWAFASIAPPLVVLTAQSCDPSGYATVTGSLTATAMGSAPAFETAPISIKVAAAPTSGAQVGTAMTNLTAGYYGALDVQSPTTIATIAPGESGVFTFTITNIGNAPTLVTFDVTGGEGVKADALDAVTLAPKQAMPIQLRYHAAAANGAARVDRGDPVTVKLTTTSVKDAALKGQSPTVSFRVNTLTPPVESKKTPDVGIVAALGALAFVAWRRRA